MRENNAPPPLLQPSLTKTQLHPNAHLNENNSIHNTQYPSRKRHWETKSHLRLKRLLLYCQQKTPAFTIVHDLIKLAHGRLSYVCCSYKQLRDATMTRVLVDCRLWMGIFLIRSILSTVICLLSLSLHLSLTRIVIKHQHNVSIVDKIKGILLDYRVRLWIGRKNGSMHWHSYAVYGLFINTVLLSLGRIIVKQHEDFNTIEKM